MHRHIAGFTLIELIITMAILAIAGGIAMPAMHTLIEHQRTSATIESMLAHIQMTRMAAVNHNQRAVLCPSSNATQCNDSLDWSPGWMLFLDGNGDRRHDPDEPILRAELTPAPHTLRIVSSRGRHQLRYLPNGSAAGSNLTLSVCNSRGKLLGRVIVNNMGRSRSERPHSPRACPG